MSIPVRTLTIDVLRRLADFYVRQDPLGAVSLGVASEDGYWLEGQWNVLERDDRGMNADQTLAVLSKKASDLGLVDPTIADMIVTVMGLVLSGTLKLVVNVTITATAGGQPIAGAQWSLSEPGAAEPFFVGASGQAVELSIFLNKDFRVYAAGYQPYFAAGVDLLTDTVLNVPLTAA